MTKRNSPMFNQVHLIDKKIIFRSLPMRKTKIMMKNDELVVRLEALASSSEKILECQYLPFTPNETLPDLSQVFENNISSLVVLNFSFNEDRYFMQTTASLDSGKISVDLAPDLFVLQRRRSARVDITFSYPHQIRVIEHHGKPVFIEGRMVDFGAGGCRLEILQMNPQFTEADELVVVLRLSHRNPLTLKSQVRHASSKTSQGNQIFGVQFLGLGPIMENKMMSLLMEVQKELFAKFNA